MKETTLARKAGRDGTLDFFAIGVATLCILHCLALPLLISAVSLSIPFVESELTHKVLVLLALPISLYAIYADAKRGGRAAFILTATAGLALLLGAAFLEIMEAHEELLTTTGSILLVAAHLWRATRGSAKAATHKT